MRSGLICHIYKDATLGDCSLDGINAKNDKVLLVLPNGGPFSEEYATKNGVPIVRMVERSIFGKTYKHLEPDAEGTYAAGGCYVKTCDSRFPNEYPLSLHDRDMSKDR